MSSTNFIILAIQVFSLMVLANDVASADYSALLSLLYKKAAASDRPLIVLIDSNVLQSDAPSHKKHFTPLDSKAYNKFENRVPINDLLHKRKKTQNNLSYKPPKYYDIEKKLHHALLPMQKRILTKQKQTLRSPIIRNLLRISNNLKCEARNECEDTCNDRYTGNKNNNCIIVCDKKFQCDEEPEDDGCDDCEENSCGDNSCAGSTGNTGSTKGYAETDPPVGCPEC